jgi:hypothetical protein
MWLAEKLDWKGLRKVVSVMVSVRHADIRFTLEAVKVLGKFRNQMQPEPNFCGVEGGGRRHLTLSPATVATYYIGF